MKRNLLIILVIVIIIVACFALFVFSSSKINISKNVEDDAYIIFQYDNKNVNEKLTQSEKYKILDIVNGKRLYEDTPSCGFCKNISIKIGELTFCVACDGCPIIKFGDEYANISGSERNTLNEIFIRYGGFFPCV